MDPDFAYRIASERLADLHRRAAADRAARRSRRSIDHPAYRRRPADTTRVT
jgi:hypothetical protein